MPVVTFNGGGSGHTSNKGSCADLEAYKEHEKELRAQENRAQEANAKCQIFGAEGAMTAEESTRFIDSHRKGLKKDEAKFYEFEINLSEGEQLAMFKDCATEAQKEEIFQNFIRNEVMEEYAQNFKGYTDKSKKPIEFHKEDICWTAVIHTERSGQEAQKWRKEHPDMQRADWHAHVTVAHRTMNQTRSISPKKNQRSSNKGSCQGYFDRNNFRQRIEQAIDMRFGYKRPLSDSLQGRQQKLATNEQHKQQQLNDVNFNQAKKNGTDAAHQRIASVKRRKHLEAQRLKEQMEREAKERKAAAEERANRIKVAVDSPEGQRAVSAIVANAKNPSRATRYNITDEVAQAVYLALGKVQEPDETRELTKAFIKEAKAQMGGEPVNWVELLREDIERVTESSISVKEELGVGEAYDKAITSDIGDLAANIIPGIHAGAGTGGGGNTQDPKHKKNNDWAEKEDEKRLRGFKR